MREDLIRFRIKLNKHIIICELKIIGMRHRSLRLFSFIVLVSYLASCSTLPKPVNLSPVSPLISQDEERKTLVFFRIEGHDDPAALRTMLMNRLKEYLGPSTRFDLSSSPTIEGALEEAKGHPMVISDVIVIDLKASNQIRTTGSSDELITRGVSGKLSIYSVKVGQLIGTQQVNAQKSVENSEPGAINALYGILIVMPLSIWPCIIASAFVDDCIDKFFDTFGVKRKKIPHEEITPAMDTHLVAQMDHSIKQLVSQYATFIDQTRESPGLVARASFVDRDGVRPNRILDAGERAELIITVENQGRGLAYDVVPVISGEGKGFIIGERGSLGTIPAQGRKEVRVPILGELHLGNGQGSLIIEVKEKRGYDAKKVKLSFQTARLERPNLVVKSVRVNDGTEGVASGNANGIIENGETVELHVFVENTGVGDAYGVKLSLIEATPSGVEVVQGEGDIGHIGVKETGRGKVVIRIPRPIDVATIQAKFRVEEVERKAAKIERAMSFTATTLKPSLAIRIDWNDGDGGQARGNGNGIWESGETVEGTITVHNRGSIPAEGVELIIQAAGSVTLGQREFRVGRLGPNQTSTPLRTTVTVPRTYEGKDIVIETIMRQQDFPEVKERQVQAVTLRRPSLVVVQRLLNQTKGEGEAIGSVVQGENAKLEIRIRNEGRLDAQAVVVSVASEQPEIRLEGKKTFTIGAIPSGQTSEPVLIPMNVLRATPIGSAGITVEVSQEDFPRLVQKGVLMVREEGAEEVTVAGEAPKAPRKNISAPMEINRVVILSAPPSGPIPQETFDLVWKITEDITSMEVRVNGEKIPTQGSRGIGLKEKVQKTEEKHLREKIPLKPGLNKIEVVAYDTANKKWTDSIHVTRLEVRSEIWAVVIGISKYQNIPSLRYARRDAEAYRAYLTEYLGVPSENIRTLFDEEVTVQSMRQTLGTWLRKKAGTNDTVFIYFAGHGAPEPDTGSGDGDGFEKYLLATDADPNDLYSTALPMKEVAEIFARLSAERVVFIVDSCFSGASGGRTLLAKQGARATLSEHFLERVTEGKGRVILSASRANEVSMEDAKYGGGHGVFTYYLLEGLKGKADYSLDGLVDAEEIYRYVSDKVPAETARRQTPVKKGEVEGTLIVGKVK